MNKNYDRYGAGAAEDTADDARQNTDPGDAQGGAGVVISGAPHWRPRELTKEYTGDERKRSGVDAPYLALTLLILMIGMIMVLSASFARGYYTNGEPMRVFTRQLVFAVSGVAIMLIVSRMSVKTMSRWSYMLLFVSFILLVAVIFIGTKVNGSQRWLGFEGGGGSFSFQPSEIAKLAIIMAFAKWTCDKGQRGMKTFRFGVLPFVVTTGLIVLLLMREPHISASIIIIALAVIMMFAGGARLIWFAPVALVIAALATLLVIVNTNGAARDNISQDIPGQLTQVQWLEGRLEYAGGRIEAWLDPEKDPLGDGFQIRQSLYAVGSGGLLGQGLGQSRQKYLYLPEEHNDYIFAVICEELGFIGAMMILMLFALLIIRGYWLALHAKSRYSALVTTGITSLLAIQVFLNVAVVTNLLPATGISLPFFSSGGTALWIQLLQMGIVLAVSRDIPVYKEEAAP